MANIMLYNLTTTVNLEDGTEFDDDNEVKLTKAELLAKIDHWLEKHYGDASSFIFVIAQAMGPDPREG